MKGMIIAVGGTGQLILHYYFQLYLLGIVSSPFKAILVDTDDPLPSLDLIGSFLNSLRYTDQENQGFSGIIPSLAVVPVGRPAGETLRDVATGSGNWGPRPHPIQAYYEATTLDNDLQKGLFSRPAMSAALDLDDLPRKTLRPDASSNVVVVGSIIGGTGGGLIAPVLHTINETASQVGVSTKIRAVFFGEWFRPKENIIDDDVARWKSNQFFVLKSVGDHLREVVHSYKVVGGPSTALADRPPEQKLSLSNMAWPEPGSPLWQGIEALHWLLEDTMMDRKLEFSAREVSADAGEVPHKLAAERLATSRSISNALVWRNVVATLASDPIPRVVWGPRLVRFISHFWGIVNQVASKQRSTRNFPDDVQRSLIDWWVGQPDRPGLEKLFPAPAGVEATNPIRIRRARWSELPSYAQSSVLFGSYEDTVRRTAATLLLDALRGA